MLCTYGCGGRQHAEGEYIVVSDERADLRPGRLIRWPVYAFIVMGAILTGVAVALSVVVPEAVAPPYVVTDFSYSPDGRTALRAGNDGTLRLFEATNDVVRKRIEGLDAPIVRAIYGRSGRQALVGSPNRISVVDLASGAVVRSFRVSGTLVALAVSPDGSKASVLGRDGKVRIYRTSGDLLATIESSANGAAILGTTWCPWECLLLWGEDGMFESWNPAEPAFIAALNGHRRTIRGAVFSADGARLGVIDDDNAVMIRDGATGNMMSWLPSLHDRPIALAWSRDRSMIAVETETGKAYIWRREGDTQPVVVGPRNGTGQGWIAFSPSGRAIVLGSWP
jgi:WD40 repeat protein